MPLHTGVFSIIHAAADADFTNYVYHQVYAGADATPTINGVAVTMAAASILNLNIKSISATNNVFLLGDKRDVTFGTPTLSLYPNP